MCHFYMSKFYNIFFGFQVVYMGTRKQTKSNVCAKNHCSFTRFINNSTLAVYVYELSAI